MDTRQKIYHLISLSQDFYDSYVRYMKRNEEYKSMSKDERKMVQKDYTPDPKFGVGSAYRGCWLDRDELVKIVETSDDPYGICECYYNYLVIETRYIGEIDDVCWEEDGELWYKADYNKESGEFKYVSIPKPECFIGTCSFT